MCTNSWWWEVRIYSKDWKIKDSDTMRPWNNFCPPEDKVYWNMKNYFLINYFITSLFFNQLSTIQKWLSQSHSFI